MYKLKCYELPEGSKSARGTNIINLLPMQQGEKLAAVLTVKAFEEDKNVVMITTHGKIKRTSLSAYKNVRKNGLIAIGMDEGDEIAGVRLTNGSNRLFIATKNGMAIRIDENDVRLMSRSAHGVKAITLRGTDEVVSIAREREGASLMTVTEKGYGKRTLLSEYRIQSRGGLGLHNYKVDEERGGVCGIKVVDETDDLMLISSDGVIIRLPVSQIRMMGRTAKGVRVMHVNDVNLCYFLLSVQKIILICCLIIHYITYLFLIFIYGFCIFVFIFIRPYQCFRRKRHMQCCFWQNIEHCFYVAH